MELWPNGHGTGLMVKALDSECWGPVFKVTGWIQGQLSLLFF